MKKYAILPLETVEHLILMTEAAQAFVHGRSVKELIDDGQMPYCYLELIAAKENAWNLESLEHWHEEGTSKMNFSRPFGIRFSEILKTILQMSSIKYGILPIKVIDELILKIQAYEMALEENSGRSTTIQEPIEDAEMPDVYHELIAAMENAWTLEKSERNEKKRKSIMKLTRDYSRIAEPDKTI